MSLDLSVVIPLYNEEESLPELVEWIERVCTEHKLSHEIIMIDDGSTDDSWKVVEELARDHQSVKGIKFQRNYGKSPALHEGFKAAMGNVVITMDADLQDSPDEIPELYSMIMTDGYDLVSGWKKVRYDNAVTKNLPSKLYNGVNRRLTGIKLHDMNCGLKSYKRKVVKSIEVYGEMHRFIPVLAKYAGFKKIGEKVVQHRPRKYGSSKFGWERFINGFLDLLSIQFVSRFGKKPMHLFGALGSFTFLLGFFFTASLIIDKIRLGADFGITNKPAFYLSLLAMMMGTLFFLTGFIAELITRNAADRNVYLMDEKIGWEN
ncbi:glycosyltransferase [Flavipsychrobacter stenotrophus]|uniref:Glycosyltransferase n=1 Tax=Flavipsychrobacter stenotrophus TaxID=2077091 RepID=A0A2S7SVF0_9BACT|nr:glycosyltransferase family 2 protein [Flavipsychrobacter stenotrophus]PQJ10601.1 glycosyltransferase [Flavipsychrobacter stenotrophus]